MKTFQQLVDAYVADVDAGTVSSTNSDLDLLTFLSEERKGNDFLLVMMPKDMFTPHVRNVVGKVAVHALQCFAQVHINQVEPTAIQVFSGKRTASMTFADNQPVEVVLPVTIRMSYGEITPTE